MLVVLSAADSYQRIICNVYSQNSSKFYSCRKL